MICSKSWATFGSLALPALLLLNSAASAVEFTTAFGDDTNATNWGNNRLIAQGFKASVSPTPDPGLQPEDTVYLTRFDFFKSGSANTGLTFRLAIVNNYFVELNTFTTSSPELVGLSTNSFVGSAQFETVGEPITFLFDNLPLTYGLDDPEQLDLNNYAAIFVTVNEGTGALTPIRVPALIVNYAEVPPGSGNYDPVADYGNVLTNFYLSASNFIDTLLVGDYNSDAKVSAADFTVWRDNVGAAGLANRDPNFTDPVDIDDFNTWLANYGTPSPARYLDTFNPDYGDARFVAYMNDVGPGEGLSAGQVSVPEPTTLAIAGLAVIALFHVRLIKDQKRRLSSGIASYR